MTDEEKWLQSEERVYINICLNNHFMYSTWSIAILCACLRIWIANIMFDGIIRRKSQKYCNNQEFLDYYFFVRRAL